LPTIDVEIQAPLGRAFRLNGQDISAAWQEDVAPGETLGRMLERATYAHPPIRDIYDPRARRLAPQVELLVNGRLYNLIGGLTYTLSDGDRITLSRASAADAGSGE
jgi:hypothetical protein